MCAGSVLMEACAPDRARLEEEVSIPPTQRRHSEWSGRARWGIGLTLSTE